MPSVDLNRLKANYAQSLASTWLSRMCLVRPVAEGTDIGIDLYCESVLEGVPFLHFWVQVKAISSSSIAEKGGVRTARFSFDKRHLEYWDRQPIPVYGLLVPVESWPPKEPIEIFGVRLSEELIKGGVPANNSVTYHTKNSFHKDSLDQDLKSFVTEIVPWDSSVLLLRQGIVAPLPGQPDRFPVGIGFQNFPKFLSSIRDASVLSLMHVVMGEDARASDRNLDRYQRLLQPWDKGLNSTKEPIRKHFESIAATFEHELHFLGLSALAWSARAGGDFEGARAYLLQAEAKVSADSTLQESERSRLLTDIQELIEGFKKVWN